MHSKNVPFQTIQLSIRTQFSHIWPIDRTLSGATIPGQSEPGIVYWPPTRPGCQNRKCTCINNRRTGKKHCHGHKSGGPYVAVLFGLQLPLTVKPLSNPFEPFQIKWEVYFSKELCRSSLLCRRYDSACICVCIVGHGYTTLGTMELNGFSALPKTPALQESHHQIV